VADIAVLIVDDQVVFRRAAAAVVEATAGFRVVAVAGSGEEALLLARRLLPDLVLMDVRLPGIDGWEAARLVRSLPSAPAVVVISASEVSDVGERLLASGALGYIPKAAFAPPRLTGVWESARPGLDAAAE
jgi:DNA-binding NarL/FixJ family response regulator